MIKSKIRVLIIEDSKLYQMYLKQVIESDECLAVAGMADCGSRALEMIPELKPDIITLDLQLPDSDDFSLLKEILQRWDTPVIVVSGDASACEKAICLGATDFIEKMQDAEIKTAEQFKLLLKLKLKMQAEIHPEPVKRRFAEARKKKETAVQPTAPPNPPVTRARRKNQGWGGGNPQRHIIAIGASLGGTEATLQILRQLPDNLPGIVIVQHMPPEFTRAYAMRLDSCCSLSVHEAENRDPVLPGTVIVAKGGEHMSVYRSREGYRVKVGGTEKIGGFCPSVDVMFRSVAQAAGPSALGVILTGMGRDGADGLRRMHDSGAYTLGQDKESCVVFGMPGVAWKTGGVDKLLTPDEIAGEIIRYCSLYKKSEADKI